MNLPDSNVNPNCLLFSEREREREIERERVRLSVGDMITATIFPLKFLTKCVVEV